MIHSHITRYEGLVSRKQFDKVTSKLQKQFIANLKKLEDLKNELITTKDFVKAVEVQLTQDIAPLHRKYNHKLAELLLILDEHYGDPFFSDEEQQKIAKYIAGLAFQLITGAGMVHLQSLYEKYTGEIIPETEEIIVETVVDEEEEEEFEEQTWNEKETYLFEKIDAELPKLTNKTARSIYMELVKEFHPDLEQDEAEKERKTKIMHLITNAYTQNDMSELLRLRMTLLSEKEAEETFVESQLKRYNKILVKQIVLLESELNTLKAGTFWQYGQGNLKTMDISIITEMNRTKKAIKELEYHKKVLKTKEYVSQFLRAY